VRLSGGTGEVKGELEFRLKGEGIKIFGDSERVDALRSLEHDFSCRNEIIYDYETVLFGGEGDPVGTR
jgi:hypothetical protein